MQPENNRKLGDCQYITASEAAELSGKSLSQIRKDCREERIKATKVGRSWQIDRVEFEASLKKNAEDLAEIHDQAPTKMQIFCDTKETTPNQIATENAKAETKCIKIPRRYEECQVCNEMFSVKNLRRRENDNKWTCRECEYSDYKKCKLCKEDYQVLSSDETCLNCLDSQGKTICVTCGKVANIDFCYPKHYSQTELECSNCWEDNFQKDTECNCCQRLAKREDCRELGELILCPKCWQKAMPNKSPEKPCLDCEEYLETINELERQKITLLGRQLSPEEKAAMMIGIMESMPLPETTTNPTFQNFPETMDNCTIDLSDFFRQFHSYWKSQPKMITDSTLFDDVHQAEIEELKEKVQELEAQLSEPSKSAMERERLEIRNYDLSLENSNMRNALNRLHVEYDLEKARLEKQIREMEKPDFSNFVFQYSISRDIIAEQHLQIEALKCLAENQSKNDYFGLEKQLEEEKKSYALLDELNGNLHETVAELEAEVAKLRQTCQDLRNEKAQLKAKTHIGTLPVAQYNSVTRTMSGGVPAVTDYPTTTQPQAENLNLLRKLLAVRKAIPSIEKDGKNTFQTYDYVSSTNTLHTVRTKLDDQNILLIPEIISQDTEKCGKNGTDILTKLRIRFRWIDVDSGEELECPWEAQGVDNQEKGIGKALTYAEKYFLLKFFQIPTDKDDPDYGHSNKSYSQNKKPYSSQKQTKKQGSNQNDHNHQKQNNSSRWHDSGRNNGNQQTKQQAREKYEQEMVKWENSLIRNNWLPPQLQNQGMNITYKQGRIDSTITFVTSKGKTQKLWQWMAYVWAKGDKAQQNAYRTLKERYPEKGNGAN